MDFGSAIYYLLWHICVINTCRNPHSQQNAISIFLSMSFLIFYRDSWLFGYADDVL